MSKIYIGDALTVLKTLDDESVQCCVTSPPYYGLRDYGIDGQLGLEKTPEEYVNKLVEVFREVKRVLRNDGTLWLNLGDSYSSYRDQKQVPQTIGANGVSYPGHEGASNWNIKMLKAFRFKHKDLMGIPWRVAFALQSDSWYLRQDIIWSKPNPMPESVTDRCTKAHEYIFLMSKLGRYYYDNDAVAEPANFPNQGKWSQNSNKGYKDNQDFPARKLHESITGDNRNRRSVWTINTKPYKDAHFATFPPELPEICIKAGSKEGDTILDPFAGSGTVGQVARNLGRNFILIELNPKYIEMQEKRSVDLFCQPEVMGV